MNEAVNIVNRKASFDYHFIREIAAGIQLHGSEVKQIRRGKVSLVDAYCFFEKGELFVKGMNITEMPEAFTHEPLRTRKLLLKKNELSKLEKDLTDGLTVVVKKLFTNDRGIVKILIALARGKKNFDKRASIKDKESRKELRQL